MKRYFLRVLVAVAVLLVACPLCAAPWHGGSRAVPDSAVNVTGSQP